MLSVDLLSELIDSSDLIVMQTEFALYALLKVWTYLKIHQTGADENSNETTTTATMTTTTTTHSIKANPEIVGYASNYFSNLKLSTSFLHTKLGHQFIKPFSKLRLQHLINHPVDIKLILEDNIIPKEWLYTPFMLQWNSLIKIDNCMDSG